MQHLGLIPADEAIFVRFLDKVSRMANLLKRDPAVQDESLYDTIEDAIAYLGILYILRVELEKYQDMEGEKDEE